MAGPASDVAVARRSIREIGLARKIPKLPCEMPSACRSDSSIGFPRIRANTSGAASKLNYRMR